MHREEEQSSKGISGYGELGKFILGLIFYCNYASF
jgi:hypothetical protein